MLFSLALVFSFSTGSVFASTTLEKTVDELLGTKYTAGGNNPDSGFDCSGFTSYVFKQFGIKLSRPSGDQSHDGTKVKKADLKPGDLVFFDTNGKNNGVISHVGIYLGDDVFVHAASGSKNKAGKVMKNKLSETYYANSYVTAARVLTEDEFKKIASEIEEAEAVQQSKEDSVG